MDYRQTEFSKNLIEVLVSLYIKKHVSNHPACMLRPEVSNIDPKSFDDTRNVISSKISNEG